MHLITDILETLTSYNEVRTEVAGLDTKTWMDEKLITRMEESIPGDT